MADNRINSEQFQLRLPPGLRDRIKAYAESYGRSTNAEIVRILEREFPEPVRFEITVNKIREMIHSLEKGFDANSLGMLEEELRKALQGVVSGRVYDAPEDAYQEITKLLERWSEVEFEDAQERTISDLDEEEFENLQELGTTAKIVFPEERQKIPRKNNRQRRAGVDFADNPLADDGED